MAVLNMMMAEYVMEFGELPYRVTLHNRRHGGPGTVEYEASLDSELFGYADDIANHYGETLDGRVGRRMLRAYVLKSIS